MVSVGECVSFALCVPPFGVVLCTNFPFILKQRADQVDLNR